MGKKCHEQNSQAQSTPLFLEHVKVTSFGKFSNIIVGPFRPGLNVVYGPNEAGKTTLSELIKGVLFGWPTSRGQGNSYRPEGAERIGSLFFRNPDNDTVLEVKRAKNSEGATNAALVLSDIDEETYRTIFALTSDELLKLDRHNEVTSHLLTAGSGTGSSPAKALDEVNERIRQKLSRSSKNPDSVPNLKEQRNRLRERVHKRREEADALRSQEKTLDSLASKRDLLAKTQEELNAEIESLKTCKVQLESLDSSLANARDALHEALQLEDEAHEQEGQVPVELADLVALSAEEELHLCDTLEDFEQKRAKLEHSLDAARMDVVRSESDYEVFAEAAGAEGRQKQFALQRKTKIGLAVAIAVVMAVAGSFVLYRSPATGGLSYLVIGMVLVIFSLVIAASGISMALKPTHDEDVLEEDLKKRRWVVQQDQKTVAACERSLADFDAQVTGFMDANGLKAAAGSLRRARRIMSQLADYRTKQLSATQNHQARTLQCASLRTELATLRSKRIERCRLAGFADGVSASDVQQAVQRKEQERRTTANLLAETERQYGEISERLAAARTDFDFDEAKFQCEQVEANLKEAYRQLAVLFIAKRSLETAIAEWERKSQPEVYRTASRLLSQMTGGAWQRVRMNAEGDLEVLDEIRAPRSPKLLSLGTRQQLYLSLRIALLMSAPNVGGSLPVLCDDILVNFDDERRKGAAKALVELAKQRQVILFTCHADVAALMVSVDPRINSIQL